MKPLHGVILAGGTGSRLRPLTNELNKHLLLVHDRPMIYYPLRTLADAGVLHVTVVTNAHHIGMMRDVVAEPGAHGLESIQYASQGMGKGVAAALAASESTAQGSPVMVLLGDNIFADSLCDQALAFTRNPIGAHIFLTHVEDTAELALAEIKDARVSAITEKPDAPHAGFAVTGAYLYDHTIFERIRALSTSARGELEITALNQTYLDGHQLGHSVLTGQWADAGTFDGLDRAAHLVKQFPSAQIHE